MNYHLIAFWVIAAAMVFFALLAVVARNIVNAAFGLLGALSAVAGFFVLLDADFLAVAQVVLYVGGIVVLLIFGVLLTNRRYEDLLTSARGAPILAASLSLALLAVLLTAIGVGSWRLTFHPALPATSQPLGFLLLQNYILPFEFASITLLAALVGASYLVRSRGRDQ